MALQTLKPRLHAPQLVRVAVLETKAGATERMRGRPWVNLRRQVLARDRYTCAVCGLVRTDHEVDHRIPLEQGGSNEPENLQTLCAGPDGCHARKTRQEAAQRAGKPIR